MRTQQFRTIESWADYVVRESVKNHSSSYRDDFYSDLEITITYPINPVLLQWGMVLHKPYYNTADILEESNYDCILRDMTKKYPRECTSDGSGIWIKLIRKDGKLTQAGLAMFDILYRLEDYAVYNEEDFSNRESEADYNGNLESIRWAMHKPFLTDDNVTPEAVCNWMYSNHERAIEHASTGYSGGGGYLQDNDVLYALFGMQLIDRTAYDDSEWDDLTDEIADYWLKELRADLQWRKL